MSYKTIADRLNELRIPTNNEIEKHIGRLIADGGRIYVKDFDNYIEVRFHFRENENKQSDSSQP